MPPKKSIKRRFVDALDISQIQDNIANQTRLNKIFIQWQLNFLRIAHPHQIIDFESETADIFLVLGGRGCGKTRMAVHAMTELLWLNPGFRALVIAPTASDLRGTCFYGESGFMECVPHELIKSFNKTHLELVFNNGVNGEAGSMLRGIPASEVERLRGGNFHICWHEEYCSFQYLELAWRLSQLSVRLGKKNITLITSTPKPSSVIFDLIERSKRPNSNVKLISASSFANLANLSKTFASMIKDMAEQGDSPLARQEIFAEVLSADESGWIKESWILPWFDNAPLPRLDKVFCCIDPALTDADMDKFGKSDPTACTIWGLFYNSTRKLNCLVLLDAWEERLGVPALIKRLLDENKKSFGADIADPQFKPLYGAYTAPITIGRKIDLFVCESIGGGSAIQQMLSEYGLKVFAYKPTKSKLERLHDASIAFSAKLIYMPATKTASGGHQFLQWTKSLRRQLCEYAGEGSISHDDLMDTATSMVLYAMQAQLLGKPPDLDKDYIQKKKLTPLTAYDSA